MTQFRDLEGVKGNGKLDAFRVDWRIIKPDPLNDLRDLTTTENREHIEWLKGDIEIRGVEKPLTIRTNEGEEILAVDGRCRLTALAELEAEGREVPKTVLVLPEARGTDQAERNIGILVSGIDRKNFDQFEIARGLKRQLAFGWSEQQICDRMRWKTVTTLHNYLDALALQPKLKEMVDKGQISRTEALRMQKDTSADPGQILQDAEDEHKRLHKKGPVRLRPKDIKRATGKAKPQEPKHAPVQTEAAPLMATPSASLPGIPADRTIPQSGDDHGMAAGQGNSQHEVLNSPTPPTTQGADAAAAQDGPPALPVPPTADVDYLQVLFWLTSEARPVLNHNKDGDNPGYWTMGFEAAVRRAERVLADRGMATGGEVEPSTVDETRALAEGADA